MEIPQELREAIDAQLTGENLQAAVARAPQLSRRYRSRTPLRDGLFVCTEEDARAYILTRMPATYAAVYSALRQTLAVWAEADGLRTLLDVGTGTGAATWASDQLLSLEKIICVEPSPFMRRMGEALMRHGSPAVREAGWMAADITNEALPGSADLVTAAYVLNELPARSQVDTAVRLWHAAGRMLLLVEPGTPEGFGLLKKIRGVLTGMGAFVLAPCPHERPCPLPEADWCHFAARVPRSRAHKQAKAGDAPYEDEKFAYLALSKNAPPLRSARVLRHPARRKGHTVLSLCTESGLAEKIVTRGDGATYTTARKTEWGDGFTIDDA